MKKASFNLKSIKATALVALMSLCAHNSVQAQPSITTPSTADNVWFSPSSVVSGLATAMIAYGSGNTIYACATFKGGAQTIYINDDAVGVTSVTPTGNVNARGFDLVIGNWDGVSAGCTSCVSPSTDYIMACSYVSGGNVRIDYYDIYDDGISTVSVNPLPSLTSSYSFQPPLPANSASTVHMDLIAEAGNTSTTGRPFCNKFVVTWDNVNNPGTVFADTSTLNNPRTPLVATQISTNPAPGMQPDVSYIQRDGFSPPNTIHDIAIFTYVGTTFSPPFYYMNKLKMREWDCTANSFSAVTQLDALAIGGKAFEWPRIDALDDYNNNQIMANANYKIACRALINTGIPAFDMRTYDALQIGSTPPYYDPATPIDVTVIPQYSSMSPGPGYILEMPSVALGPHNYYEVLHGYNFNGYGSDSFALFLEQIDIANPTATVGNNVFWLNTDGNPLYAQHVVISSSVSAPVNDYSIASVFVWSLQDYNTGNYEVHYKTIGTTYAFKNSPSVVANVQQQKWLAYPNPVQNQLILENSADYEATSYRVFDIMGRNILSGAINNHIQHVDISQLNTGNYVIAIYNKDAKKQSMTFAKQ